MQINNYVIYFEMKNERKKILDIDIIQAESSIKTKFKEFLKGFYEVFYFILKNPLNNFWWECISLIIQYLQLMIFIFDGIVSFIFLIVIVFEYLE